VDVSEKNLEATIEALLLAGGPDAYPGGTGVAAEFPEGFDYAPGGGNFQVQACIGESSVVSLKSGDLFTRHSGQAGDS